MYWANSGYFRHQNLQNELVLGDCKKILEIIVHQFFKQVASLVMN